MITITPLGQKAASDTSSDASSSSSSIPSPRALAYLVQIDSAYILLDCGAPEDLRFPSTSSSPSSDDDDANTSRYVSEDGSLDTQALSLLPLDVAISHIAPRIQLVLLSHSTMHNVGLYAYARARLGLTCPAYATLPTASMARLVTLEASLTLASECDVAALEKRPTKAQLAARAAGEASAGVKKEDNDDGEDEDIKMLSSPTSSSSFSQRDRCIPLRHEIDEAFESIRTLRYLQPTVLEGSLSSLSLTAHSAGHTLGGTVWKLRSPTSGTVVLAIDWNHVRERHIDGSGVIEGAAAVAGAGANAALPTASRAGEEAAGTKRAELLVTSGARLGRVNARRKDKDKSLLDLIHHTLTVSKSTLHLPLDASPRLLEILLLLDKHWAYAYPNARFPLCLVSRTGKEVIERARTMREWMGKGVQAEEANATGSGRGGRGGAAESHGPLELRFLRIFTSLTALAAAVPADAAKVVITVGPSLLYGPSLRFFRQHVAGSRENTVVLTTERDVERGSPAEELRRWWQAGQEEGWTERDVGRAVSGDGRRLGGALEVRERRALEGRELEEFKEKEREKKEREERKRAMVQRSRKRLEADQDEDEEDGDEDEDDDDDSSADEDEDGLDPTLPPRKRGANAVIDSEAGGSALKKKRGDANTQTKDDGTAAANDDVDLLLSHDVYLRGSAARTAVNFFSGNTSSSTQQQQAQQHQRRHRTSVITAAQREREARERHGVGARFRSFPVIERRRRIDAFGEVIDVARWLSRGRKEEEERLRSEAAAAAANGGAVQLGASGTPLVPTTASSRDRGLIDQREQEEDELGGAPSKFVHLRDVDVRVHCRVHFLDLDGLIDGRALQIVLPQLAPRRLVLVDAPQPQPMEVLDSDATSWWENSKGGETITSRFVTSLLSLRDFTRDVFAPGLGCTVRVGGQVQSFDVKLGEGVLEGVEMGTYEEWALGWVEGRVVRSADEEGKGLVVLERRTGGGALSAEDEEDDAEVAEAAKEVAEAASQHPDRLTFSPHLTRPPSTLFIGSVRLSTLKTLLSTPSHGNPRIPAEFGGAGTLVCGSAALANVLGGNVGQTAGQASAACTVEKSGETITVEGNAGRTFVRVREAVYALHARVGGGVGRRGGM